MSDVTESSSRKERTYLYWAAGAVVLVLLVVALFAFSAKKSTQEAEDKADQLIAALDAAGAHTTPSQEQVVGVLGDDGGSVCQDPSSALRKAVLHGMLTNGAAGPGIRPVIADNRALAGELLVLKIYCPDELPDVQKIVDDLKTDSVIKG